jgi:hypothetical protein
VAECPACAALIGQPPDTNRHGALSAFTGRKDHDGWHEMYLCRACGTRLQRVVPEPGSGRPGAPWSKAN